jgi:beta-lactamase regulating signal transducer with metallopeptidase domain
MTPLQRTLLLCAVQVTLLALVACVIQVALRKRSPAVRSSLTLNSLFAIFIVSLLAFSPWPNWTGSLWNRSEPAQPAQSAIIETREATTTGPSEPVSREFKASTPDSTWAAAWDGFRTAMTSSETAPTADRHWTSIPTILAALFACGLIVGCIRLIGGWIAVARLRSLSRPLNEPSLRELIDILQAEAGCSSRIETRESLRLATAATIGWRKPIILLPTAWREWTPTEMRAVLAHEIAHIHHRDYAAWLLAQASVVLHFYHPLVHWLAARLRLDQELAADAAAAEYAGGRQSYLETLAQLALRQADRPVSWPVRAFLPTHQTFLRRLQMLRDPGQFSNRSPGRMRWASLAAMMAAGLLVAGLRGPGESLQALAADAPTLILSEAPAPLSLAYVPRDAVAVVGLHPANAIRVPALKPVADALLKDGEFEKAIGLGVDQIDSVVLIYLLADAPEGAPPINTAELVMAIRTHGAGQAKTMADKICIPDVSTDFDGHKILSGRENGKFVVTDDRTLLMASSEPVLRRALIAGPEGRPAPAIADSWASVSSASCAAAALNMSLIGGRLNGPFLPPEVAAFSPLWTKLHTAAASLDLASNFQLVVSTYSASPQDAQQVKDTLSALLVLARNTLSGLRSSISKLPANDSALGLRMSDMAEDLLDKAKLEQTGPHVTFRVNGDSKQVGQLAGALVPAIQQAKTAAQRTQDKNKILQIMLALHNYHDANGHFPAAAVLGPDGKTYHSWRVAILPYLEQGPLYNDYHFDEPWDSDHNQKLVEKIPAFFRSAADPPSSTNASFFAITGNGTIWSNPDGTKLSEITDGTSNTICVVEAKRDIPWTKPEDIPYDAAKPLPAFGGRFAGGFHAALADGSVRFVSQKIQETVLRALLTENGGEVIQSF